MLWIDFNMQPNEGNILERVIFEERSYPRVWNTQNVAFGQGSPADRLLRIATLAENPPKLWPPRKDNFYQTPLNTSPWKTMHAGPTFSLWDPMLGHVVKTVIHVVFITRFANSTPSLVYKKNIFFTTSSHIEMNVLKKLPFCNTFSSCILS